MTLHLSTQIACMRRTQPDSCIPVLQWHMAHESCSRAGLQSTCTQSSNRMWLPAAVGTPRNGLPGLTGCTGSSLLSSITSSQLPSLAGGCASSWMAGFGRAARGALTGLATAAPSSLKRRCWPAAGGTPRSGAMDKPPRASDSAAAAACSAQDGSVDALSSSSPDAP